MTASIPSAILLLSCPDRQGIVAALSAVLFAHHGTILSFDQYVDHDEGIFFARIEWALDGFDIPLPDFPSAFTPLAMEYQIQYTFHDTLRRPRIAILVSRQAHCLYDILSRTESGEWPCEPVLVLSNHEDLRPLAERHNLPFHCIPVTAATRDQQEPLQIKLLQEAGIDLVILARYMQILSPAFIRAFPMRIINIHHSFLPAFAGARPYQAAHDRGVKIIGATAHYATENLDEGPIIEQDVVRVSHRGTVADWTRLGADLEKIVLARAVRHHLLHHILVHGRRTIIFGN